MGRPLPAAEDLPVSASFPLLDFDDFHRRELPRRLAAGHGAVAAEDASLASLGGLAFRLKDGGAFSYLPRDGGVEVVEGEADARTVIEI